GRRSDQLPWAKDTDEIAVTSTVFRPTPTTRPLLRSVVSTTSCSNESRRSVRMDPLDLARWQFAITTVYHYFFVPVTIGLSAMVAYFESRWLRHRDPQMLRLAKFFGKLFTINFALGLATGLVQEFQFGMNWSDYSRFVGDI